MRKKAKLSLAIGTFDGKETFVKDKRRTPKNNGLEDVSPQTPQRLDNQTDRILQRHPAATPIRGMPAALGGRSWVGSAGSACACAGAGAGAAGAGGKGCSIHGGVDEVEADVVVNTVGVLKAIGSVCVVISG